MMKKSTTSDAVPSSSELISLGTCPPFCSQLGLISDSDRAPGSRFRHGTRRAEDSREASSLSPAKEYPTSKVVREWLTEHNKEVEDAVMRQFEDLLTVQEPEPRTEEHPMPRKRRATFLGAGPPPLRPLSTTFFDGAAHQQEAASSSAPGTLVPSPVHGVPPLVRRSSASALLSTSLPSSLPGLRSDRLVP